MIRNFILSSLLFVAVFSSKAGSIDNQTARNVAAAFIAFHECPAGTSLAGAGSDFTIIKDGNAVLFVFNLNPQGFVIIPANTAASPILAYSFESNYSQNNQPENFSLWMEGYAGMVKYLIDNDVQPSQGNIDQWNFYLNNSSKQSKLPTITAGPLIASLWDQGYPYNMLCPEDQFGPGGHVYAGCVATAMSQVLYYWRYPQQGTGSHGYTWDPYGYLFADFGNTTYKWEEMVNAPTAPNFEIAQLQSQLGISVDMMYSPNGSGAYSWDAAQALKTWFGFSDSLQLVSMEDYPYEDWKTLLRTQIDASHPMYYHGFGSGGHAFNVDGYQDTAYFHFNWGWSGSYNGYFHLFNLNPGGNSFTEGQGAIINFYPSGNYATQCGSTDTLTLLAGTMEDGSGPIAPYFDNSACNWLIAPLDTLENIKLSFLRFDLEDGKDFIKVYDGADTTAPLIGNYTGSTIPPVTSATSGKMFIRFITDGSGTSNGWLASYTAKQAQFCSGTALITDISGSLDDGSGNFNYHNNTLCRYNLEPGYAQSISITFNEFNTAGEGDFVAIYDQETHQLYHKLSGQANPGTLNFNTGKLNIIFKTDEANPAPGWSFTYSSSPTTSLDEDPSGSNPMVFPNPAHDKLQVNLNNLEKGYSLKLMSTEGKSVFSEISQTASSNVSTTIDLSKLPRSVYVLQINTLKGSTFKKVIVE